MSGIQGDYLDRVPDYDFPDIEMSAARVTNTLRGHVQGDLWAPEEILDRMLSDDRWLVHGLLALYRLQTDDERKSRETTEHNGVGFGALDAGILTGISEFYFRAGFLTSKQLGVLRTRLPKYSTQLAKLANGTLITE